MAENSVVVELSGKFIPTGVKASIKGDCDKVPSPFVGRATFVRQSERSGWNLIGFENSTKTQLNWLSPESTAYVFGLAGGAEIPLEKEISLE